MKIEFNSNTQTVMFICSPNLSILDNWIPILQLLRKKLQDAKFVFIIPKTQVVSEIELNSSLIKFSKDIFDLIIFKSESGVWLCENTFDQIKQIHLKSSFRYFNYVIRNLDKLYLRKSSFILSTLYKKIISIFFKKNVFKIDIINKTKYFTLFDLHELKQSYMKELYETITTKPNFSIAHEISPRGLKDNYEKKNFHVNKSMIFSFSDRELEFYKNTHGLCEDQIKVYGIPRHEKNWIKTVIEKENCAKNEKKYIFLISKPIRPALPENKKKIYLEFVKSIADKFDFDIIIKLHPKEKYNKLFEDVFGINEYNKSWKLSTRHPFFLGKNCEFAISLGSGVPIDLLVLDIPSIQIQNLKGIKEFDNDFSLRDIDGNPVNTLKFLNLVLEAKSFNELEKHVNNILSNRHEVIKKLQNEYNNVYKTFNNVNELIVKNIIGKI